MQTQTETQSEILTSPDFPGQRFERTGETRRTHKGEYFINAEGIVKYWSLWNMPHNEYEILREIPSPTSDIREMQTQVARVEEEQGIDSWPKQVNVRNHVGDAVWQIYHVNNDEEIARISGGASANGFNNVTVDNNITQPETFPNWRTEPAPLKPLETMVFEVGIQKLYVLELKTPDADWHFMTREPMTDAEAHDNIGFYNKHRPSWCFRVRPVTIGEPIFETTGR